MTTWGEIGIVLPAQHGGEVDVTCPRCSQGRRNKSARCLSVNVDKGLWICHHCEWRGSLEKGEENAPQLRRAYRPPTLPPLTDLPRNVVTYFESRGIPERVLRRNQIQFGSVYFPQVEDHRNAILFPYYRGETLVNVKYRTGDKMFRMHGGAERILYGLGDVAETTVIVEGEIDKLAVETAGIEACVSVPDGAPAPNSKGYASKFDFLEADAETLAKVKTWILAVDNDAPGKRLEDELVRRFGAERCRRVEWPAGCKDANDVLTRHGFDRLKRCLDEAKPYPVEGLVLPSEIRDMYDALYDRGLQPGLDPGWPSLAKLYTVRAGEWTLVTGIPSHGKSTALDALLVNLIMAHGWRIGICSPENLPIQRHMAGIAAKMIGKPFHGPNRMDADEKNLALYQMDEHLVFILPGEPTVDNVLDRARIAVARRGITGLVIDPWNELDHSRPSRLSETEYISDALTRIRRFAREYGVHVWLVAHPTKIAKVKDRDSGVEKYPVPDPYSVSGSAHWRNKADNAITIYRDIDGNSNLVEWHVQKVRFREVGQQGVAKLLYDRETGTFGDLGLCTIAGQEIAPAPPTPPSFYEPEPPEREPEAPATLFDAPDEGALSPTEQATMRAFADQEFTTWPG